MPSGAWCATRSRANRARAFARDPNPSRARTNANLLRVAARRSHSCIFPPRDAHADPLPRPRCRRSGCGRTGRELFVESMKEPGGPFQRCLATCARERAAREAEEKEAKKFEEYLYANVNLETGEMLAPEEAPSLLPAGRLPAAAAAAAAAPARSPPPRPPPPRRAPGAPASPTAARARPSASAARASSGAPTPTCPEPRAHERLLALVAGRLGGGAVQAVLRSPGGFPMAPASLSHAYALRDSLS